MKLALKTTCADDSGLLASLIARWADQGFDGVCECALHRKMRREICPTAILALDSLLCALDS
jgi:hypothetical protein